MEKVTAIKVDERELLPLVNQHFNIDCESIVAIEELGNQDWVVEVSPHGHSRDYFIDAEQNCIKNFYFRDALARMCFDGVLEAGTYIIDCTW